MTDAAVIPAAYVKLSTMVDGTIRVVIDVEPTNRDAAFALFDRPGASLAIARLSDRSAVEHDRKAQAQSLAEPLERKPLSLASRIAIACGDESMPPFLRELDPDRWRKLVKPFDRVGVEKGLREQAREMASQFVRDWCGVVSRAEITPGSKAGDKWLQLEASYHDWQRRRAA